MSMHNSKDSQLKLTNSIDINCIGRQNSNDGRMNTTLYSVEDSIGKVWEHLWLISYYLAIKMLLWYYHYGDIQVKIDRDDVVVQSLSSRMITMTLNI